MVSVPCGYATEGQGVTPLGAAVDGGFMRSLGLDVTLRKMGDAHAVAAGLDAGEITFGNLAAPGLVEAVSRGAALVFLAGGVNQQFLVGAPGRSLADVAGQPMGASSPGDLTDFLVQITMERVTEAESEVRYVGGSRARLRALLEGDIAASPLSPPLAVEAKHQGCAWLYDYAQLGLNFAIGGHCRVSPRRSRSARPRRPFPARILGWATPLPARPGLRRQRAAALRRDERGHRRGDV